MRDLLVAAIVFGLLPMVLKRPQVGIYLWSWISYMNPHRLAYGFAFGFPWAYMIFLVTVAGLIFSRESKRILWTRETILMLMYLAWAAVTSYFAFFPDLAWEDWIKLFKVFLVTYMTVMVITNRERLHGLIWIIALSLGFYGIKGGIFTILHGGVYRVQGPLGSFIGGNNELALALIMVVPLIRYLHLQEERKWLKTGLAGAMLLSTIAAIGSQSRGALVGILAMGLFLWLKSRQKFMTAILVVIAVGAVVAIMPQEWYDRMQSTKNYQEDSSALGRINAWHTAFNVASDRLTGGGAEMFRPSVFRQYAPEPYRVHDAHSVYFEVMGEHGFVGFGVYMAIMALAWLRGGSIIRKTKNIPELKWARDLAAMTQVSIIGFAASGLFLGMSKFDLYWHLVVVLVILSHLVSQHQIVIEKKTLPAPRFGMAAGAAQVPAVDSRGRSGP